MSPQLSRLLICIFSLGMLARPATAAPPTEVPKTSRATQQVNIRAKIVEITQPKKQAGSLDWYLGKLLITNSTASTSNANLPASITPAGSVRSRLRVDQ